MDAVTLEQAIRTQLSGGNALGANDLAAKALEAGADSPAVRYLFLRSLAESGGARLALSRYEELAPPAEARNEDWLALPGRLHKDLAFSGVQPDENLRRAARAYGDAHAHSGGAFSAVNAAAMHFLLGEQADAERFAQRALDALPPATPDHVVEQYYGHATRAEAMVILGKQEAARAALRAADPLIRDDLTTRSRTRAQLRRLCRHAVGGEDLAAELAMPMAWVAQLREDIGRAAAIDEDLGRQLHGSPCYAAEPESPEALQALNRLVETGARLHLVVTEQPERIAAQWVERFGSDVADGWSALTERVTRLSVVSGFLPVEASWRARQAMRLVHGLARQAADSLGVEVHGLSLHRTPDGSRWTDGQRVSPPQVRVAEQRRMVGLMFTDMVNFSRLTDSEVRVDWTEIVPKLAACIDRAGERVLLKQTWGDALHLVTEDARTAAELSLRLIDVARAIRRDLSGRLADLQIRVGAHYAPAFAGHDAVQDVPTFYGTPLSFAARVEPVTPPGTVYVTESFAAELMIEAGTQFLLEYAGEVELAKRFGSFRLFSLGRRDA